MIVVETNHCVQVKLTSLTFQPAAGEQKILFAIIMLLQNPKQLEMYWTKRQIFQAQKFSVVPIDKCF